MPSECVDEWFERPNLSEEAQREIWKEEKITQRLTDGQTFEKGGLEGNIVEMQTIGDKTAVIVEKEAKFTVAELDHEQVQTLKQGDHVKVKSSEITSQGNDKSKQFER